MLFLLISDDDLGKVRYYSGKKLLTYLTNESSKSIFMFLLKQFSFNLIYSIGA